MAFEDFTTYVAVDDSAELSIAANKIDYTVLAVDELVYVAKNFGTDYFGDFKIQVKVYLSEATKDGSGAAGSLVTWGMSNTYHTWYPMGVNGDGFTLRFGRTGDNYLFSLQDMDNASLDSYIVGTTVPVELWLEIERANTTLTCKVYSDAYSTLIDTMSITCETTAFSDLIAVAGVNTSSDDDTTTGYVENLEIISVNFGGIVSTKKNFELTNKIYRNMYGNPSTGMGSEI